MIQSGTKYTELQRVKALHQYDIMESFPEKEFDNITKLASIIFDVPISIISFIDTQRKWHKSKIGIDGDGEPRETSICSHTIMNGNDILLVPDTRKDERFSSNPSVINKPPAVFYAGMPLITSDGHAIGSLCVIDHRPRQVETCQLDSLKYLAGQVMKLLELKKNNIELDLIRKEQQLRYEELEKFAYVVAHDIKSPLSNISTLAKMIREESKDILDDNITSCLDHITISSNSLKNLVDGILEYYRCDQVLAQKQEDVELAPFIESVIELMGIKNKYQVNYPKGRIFIKVNRVALKQIFINIINNGIKYNDKEHVVITIDFIESDDCYCFKITDNGVGINKEDHDNIFALFTSLGQKDRDGGYGSGIGLSTVKRLVEKIGGSISLTSEVGKGSTFTVDINK